MAEVRLKIPDDIVAKLQARLPPGTKVTDIAMDALTLFNWAVEQRAKGNLVLSSDEEGTTMTRLSMPSLDRVAKV